jgi:hypothetical protein
MSCLVDDYEAERQVYLQEHLFAYLKRSNNSDDDDDDVDEAFLMPPGMVPPAVTLPPLKPADSQSVPPLSNTMDTMIISVLSHALHHVKHMDCNRLLYIVSASTPQETLTRLLGYDSSAINVLSAKLLPLPPRTVVLAPGVHELSCLYPIFHMPGIKEVHGTRNGDENATIIEAVYDGFEPIFVLLSETRNPFFSVALLRDLVFTSDMDGGAKIAIEAMALVLDHVEFRRCPLEMITHVSSLVCRDCTFTHHLRLRGAVAFTRCTFGLCVDKFCSKRDLVHQIEDSEL